MDKIKIGLPRIIYYYNEGKFLKHFLEELNFEVVLSPPTNNEIKELGKKYANDEMCLSLKIFLGHVAYLSDKCDYILNIRMDNCGLYDQGCTNYIATYDLINNLFDVEILNINIDHYNYKTLYKELLKLFNDFNIDKKQIKNAYLFSKIKVSKEKKNQVITNTNKLYLNKTKILLVGHDYNLFDEYVSGKIINYLNDYNIEVIYSTLFDKEKLKEISKIHSDNMYFKTGRESLGACFLARNHINGIIFLTSFPCGPDSLTNEYIMRKIDLPYLNLVIDDLDSDTGIETRLESFIYILEQE